MSCARMKLLVALLVVVALLACTETASGRQRYCPTDDPAITQLQGSMACPSVRHVADRWARDCPVAYGSAGKTCRLHGGDTPWACYSLWVDGGRTHGGVSYGLFSVHCWAPKRTRPHERWVDFTWYDG